MARERSKGAGPPKQDNTMRTGWPLWTKIVSAAGVVVLAFFVAIASGLGHWLVDRVLPSKPTATSGPAPTGSPAPHELVVAAFIPPDVDLSCDHDVNVAGLSASPNPRDLRPIEPGELLPAKDPRTIALKELQAVAWYRNLLKIGLSTADEVPVFILKIEPVIYQRTNTKPAWGLEFDPPCGGPAQNRVFKTVLDRGSIEDLGVVGDISYGTGPRNEPIGQAFTVSANDPAVLTIHAYACIGYFEWGLKITYLAQGEQKEAWIGTADQPLKLIGDWQGVARYHGAWEGQTRIESGPNPDRGQPVAAGVPASAREVC